MRAVVLQRDPLVNRHIRRIWRAAGLEVIGVADPNELMGKLNGAILLGADEFDRDVVGNALREHPSLTACLWMAEPIQRSLAILKREPRIISVLGRPDFDQPPRDWELLMVAQRVSSQPRRVPLSAYLNWGFTGFELRVRDTQGLEQAVARAERFVEALDVPRWMVELIAELAHELLMNAVYDAPVDASGRPRFAYDRKAMVELRPEETPLLRIGCDGLTVCVQVADPFGRLERDNVVDGLMRGLKNGQLDQSRGGAGLGLAVCHNASMGMLYSVTRNKETEVTGFFDLELNRRDFRKAARSLHFFDMTRRLNGPHREGN